MVHSKPAISRPTVGQRMPINERSTLWKAHLMVPNEVPG